ncbi:MAG: hypothetical protein GY803_11965 [Chloroflexi bacterium]|nr:hypothetical protein [Chloroflexota bacterium]
MNEQVEQAGQSARRPFSPSAKILFVEIIVLLILAIGYTLPVFNGNQTVFQQTGEHNESLSIPYLTEIGFHRYGELPRWNPYMLTGIPHAGDLVTHFFNPVATIPVLLFGAVNGVKISLPITFFLLGLGQLLLGYVVGIRTWARLWAAVIFMCSGGIAMLWHVGWYGLLLGVVWFPYALALTIWSLRSQKRAPVVLTAVAIALIFLSGSSYWLLYFLGSLLLLVPFALIAGKLNPTQWLAPRQTLYKILIIGLFAMGFAAIQLLPQLDGLAHIAKESAPDPFQIGSQPIPYALFNYVIKDPSWFRDDALGNMHGFSWFYIGVVPFLGLLFTPLKYANDKGQRSLLALMVLLTLFFLAWEANQFNPLRHVYEWIPILQLFRFPNRLLIVASSTLLSTAAFGFSYLFQKAQSIPTRISFNLSNDQTSNGGDAFALPVSWLLQLALIGLLLLSARDVFTVNKGFAFAEGQFDPIADQALTWLKEEDPSLYYINIGDWRTMWWWVPAAFKYEHKTFNFPYARVLNSWRHQLDEATPLRATPKYWFVPPDYDPPPNAELVQIFVDVGLYQLPDSLPYAFLVPKTVIDSQQPVTPQDVRAVEARLDSPNRIIVDATEAKTDELLVVLESHYPGWRVRVDGVKQELLPVGDYLGAQSQPGSRQYVFSFEPAKFTWGLMISLLAIVGGLGYSLSDVTAVRAKFAAIQVRIGRSWPD